MVVAAGNDGPDDGTLQELAQGDWVLSVGATNGDGELLPSSSRGWRDGPCPTVVADGTDYMQPPFEPGSSFAAPIVAHVAAFLARCLVLSQSDLRGAVERTWEPVGSAIALPQVGYADTGLDPSLELSRGPSAKSILDANGTAARIGRDDRERDWYLEVVQALSEAGIICQVEVSPNVVRRAIELAARPMPGERHWVGAGLVSSEIATGFVGDFLPSRWLAVFCPEASEELGRERLSELDAKLGPLWNDVRTGLLFDLFFTGVILSIARVVGGSG